MKLRIELPTDETPGFLKRARKSAEFGQRLQKEFSPFLIDELVEFILPFVTEPQDRKEAADIIWEMSKKQFMDVMKSIGGGNDTTIPPQNSAPPADGSLPTV